MTEEPNFYQPLNEDTFDGSNCFLCGKSSDIETAEHIFPKWLQRKYDLWNEKLIISNGTSIPYKNLTVPCCSKCNNEDLSTLEKRFKKLLNRSFNNLDFNDELVIFQWTAKILYSTRYKELSLLIDRKKPDLGKIISPSELESYSALHLFLQSIRIPSTFENPKPWSLFVFECEDEDFFYHNNIHALGVSFKFGKVAITIVYEENNMVEESLVRFKKLRNYGINFAQYLEVNSYIFCTSLHIENVPKFLSSYNIEENKLIFNTMGYLRMGVWNKKIFSAFFDNLLKTSGIDIGESVLSENGILTTFLVDENGEPLRNKLFDD